MKKYIHFYILTFNKSIISKEMKIGHCFEKVKQYILNFSGALNVKDMDTTRKATEDVRHVEGVTKKTQIT